MLQNDPKVRCGLFRINGHSKAHTSLYPLPVLISGGPHPAAEDLSPDRRNITILPRDNCNAAQINHQLLETIYCVSCFCVAKTVSWVMKGRKER